MAGISFLNNVIFLGKVTQTWAGTNITAHSIVADSLTSGTILGLSSYTTGATSNTLKGLNIYLSGANANTTQSTTGIEVSNVHTGTLSTNYGAVIGAGNAETNIALNLNAYGIGKTNIALNIVSGDIISTANAYFAGGVGTGDVSGESVRISNPGGASWANQTSIATGAIKITLPQSWTDTMLRMTVKVYEYAEHEGFEVELGGYNHTGSGGYWANGFAHVISDAGKDRNFTIRFGHDGTKCCIYIGEIASSWSYPQVTVTNFEGGYSSYDIDKWVDGWSIGLESTAFGTVSITEANPQVTNWKRNSQDLYYGGGTGNVGIGTDTPRVRLNATVNANSESMALGTASGGFLLGSLDNSYGINAGVGNSGKGWIQVGRVDASATAYDLSLQASGGNVGIGTISPNALLTVGNATAATNVSMSLNGVASKATRIKFQQAGVDKWMIGNGPASEDNKFAIYNGVTGEHAMIVDPTSDDITLASGGGNITIGNASSPKLYMVSSGGNGYNQRFSIEGYADGGTYGGGFKLSTRNNSNVFNPSVVVDRDGNVGIGNTLPGAKLDVTGSILVGNTSTSRFTATNSIPLQLNRGLDVSVVGAAGTVMGVGAMVGSTYTDAVQVGAVLQGNGVDGDFILDVLNNGTMARSLTIDSSLSVKFNGYSSTNHTGTPTYLLGTDSSGNVVKTLATSGSAGNWTKTGNNIYNNNSGDVLIGTTTPSSNNNYGTGDLSIENDVFASAQVFSHNSTAGNYSFFGLGKSSGTGSAPTIVQADEKVGAIGYYGYDGADYRRLAFIEGKVDGTPGAGDMPGALIFGTASDGTSSSATRYTIDSSGHNTWTEGGTFGGDVEIRSGNKLILQRPNNGVASEISTDSTGGMILNSINGEGFDFQNGSVSQVFINGAGDVGIGSMPAGNPGTRYMSIGTAGSVAGGIQLWAAPTATHYLQFGDASSGGDYYRGAIGYAHATDTLLLLQAGSTALSFTGSQKATFSNKVAVNQSGFLTSAGLEVNGFIDITDITASALRWYDGTTFIGGLGQDSWALGGSDADLSMYVAGDNSFFVLTNNVKRLEINSSGAIVTGNLTISDKLVIDGGWIQNDVFNIAAGTTQTLIVDIYNSYGNTEVLVAGYASGGTGSCVISWVDGGHGGGTTYHRIQQIARQTQGNPVLGSLIKTASGGAISIQNTSASTLTLYVTTKAYGSNSNNANVYLSATAPVGVDSSILNVDDINNRVGIGTTTPAAQLHVQKDQASETGVIFLNNNLSANAAFRLAISVGAPAGGDPMVSFNIGNGGFDWTMGVDNSDGDKFKIAGGTDSHNQNLGTNDKFVIDNVGNIGIGINNPEEKLHVVGSQKISGGVATHVSGETLRVSNPGGGALATGASSQVGAVKIILPQDFTNTMLRFTVKFYEYHTDRSFEISVGGYNYSTGTWYNTFAYAVCSGGIDRNFTARFGRDSNNKSCVYIGELNSTWSYQQVSVIDFQAGYSSYGSALWVDGWDIGYETSAFENITSTQSNTQATNWKRNGQDVYYGSGTGGVGIGITNPAHKLDVIETNNGDTIRIGNTGTYGGTIAFSQGSGNTNIGYIGSIRAFEGNGAGDNGVGMYSRNRMSFYIASATPAATITSSGNVGIGNTNNTYKLDVSGTIRATGDVIAYSDARVKDNVETIENALDKVTQLRGVSYTRNDVEDKTTKIGVIAQEVLEVVPEVVQQDDEGKYSVAYGNMVGLLIESIKELKAEVDELKSRL